MCKIIYNYYIELYMIIYIKLYVIIYNYALNYCIQLYKKKNFPENHFFSCEQDPYRSVFFFMGVVNYSRTIFQFSHPTEIQLVQFDQSGNFNFYPFRSIECKSPFRKPRSPTSSLIRALLHISGTSHSANISFAPVLFPYRSCK